MPINTEMLHFDQNPAGLERANDTNGHLRVHYHLNAGGKKCLYNLFDNQKLIAVTV
jgi:hypothetical protein